MTRAQRLRVLYYAATRRAVAQREFTTELPRTQGEAVAAANRRRGSVACFWTPARMVMARRQARELFAGRSS